MVVADKNEHNKSKSSSKHSSFAKNQLDKTRGKLQLDGKITTNEDDEIIAVGWQCYKKYFMKYYGGWVFIILAILAQGSFAVAQFYTQYIIGEWSESKNQM